jgi:hypothetical protein
MTKPLITQKALIVGLFYPPRAKELPLLEC